MGTIADGQKNKMVDALTGVATFTAQTAVYVKLHTGDPGSAGTSNAATETTRQVVTFAAASAGSAASNVAVTWTNVSTGETYTWVSFWSASSGGTFLGRDDLPASKTVNAGDTFVINSGDISIAV